MIWTSTSSVKDHDSPVSDDAGSCIEHVSIFVTVRTTVILCRNFFNTVKTSQNFFRLHEFRA